MSELEYIFLNGFQNCFNKEMVSLSVTYGKGEWIKGKGQRYGIVDGIEIEKGGDYIVSKDPFKLGILKVKVGGKII